MGSGHETTNKSVGRAHGCMTRHFIGLFSIKTADSANQEIAQWSPDPFSRERVASGHETEYMLYTFSKFTLCTSQTNMHYLLHNAYTSMHTLGWNSNYDIHSTTRLLSN